MKLKQTEVFTLTKKEDDAWDIVYGIFAKIRENSKTQKLVQIASNICDNLDEAVDYLDDVEEER